ncbi:MAG: hypothetical protein V3S29_08795 [bacterium]
MQTIERTPAGEIVRRRPCPTCAEAILPEAATRRYCGSDNSPAQTRGSGKIEPPTELGNRRQTMRRPPLPIAAALALVALVALLAWTPARAKDHGGSGAGPGSPAWLKDPVAAPRPDRGRLHRLCQQMSRKWLRGEGAKLGRDYTIIKVTAFYSQALDACIHAEQALIGIHFEIRDLSKTVIRDYNEPAAILACDVDGVDSIKLDAVRKHRGRVFRLRYKQWLDDGFGGPPRVLRKSATPYTKTQCHEIFVKWMIFLKTPK